MAGPIPGEARRRGNRRVGAGFAVVVAISAGSMAHRSGATPAASGAVALAGLLIGVVLIVALVRR